MKNKFILFFITFLSLGGCASNQLSSQKSSNTSDLTTSVEPECEHDFVLQGEVSGEPTIIQPCGQKYVCSKCKKERYEEASYDLNEYVFSDQTFMYDGQEHELLIKGMIPYGPCIFFIASTSFSVCSVLFWETPSRLKPQTIVSVKTKETPVL